MDAAPGLEVMLGGGLGRSSQPVPRLPGSHCDLGQGDQGMETSGEVIELGCGRAGSPRGGIGCGGVQWLQAWLAGLQCHSGCGELWDLCLAAVTIPTLT